MGGRRTRESMESGGAGWGKCGSGEEEDCVGER